jgi:hypothetical protein
LGHTHQAAILPKHRPFDPDAQRHQGIPVSPGLLQSTPMVTVELGPHLGGRKLPVNVHIVIIGKFFKLAQDRSTYVDLYPSNRLEKR